MVTKELIAVAKCLKALGVRSFDDVEQRISFQKKMYILRACGADLGYMFSWDMFGPYSKSLARDTGTYNKYRAEIDELIDEFQFKGRFQDGLERAKEIIKPVSDAKDVRESVWLELLSSIHFLATNGGRQSFPTDAAEAKDIKEMLFKRKPHLKDYEFLFDVAWEKLRTFLSR